MSPRVRWRVTSTPEPPQRSLDKFKHASISSRREIEPLARHAQHGFLVGVLTESCDRNPRQGERFGAYRERLAVAHHERKPHIEMKMGRVIPARRNLMNVQIEDPQRERIDDKA